MKSTYVEQRDKVISDVVFITNQAWPGDKEMKSAAINATVELEIAEPNQVFIDGLRGFISWAAQTQQAPGLVASTLIHDLFEFGINRHEAWFSPRTSAYQKYLSGASGVIA